MSRIDSLAEQMESDYKSVMLAFSGIRIRLDGMQKDIRKARKAMRAMYRTTRSALAVVGSHEDRLELVERRVDVLEGKTPPAA